MEALEAPNEEWEQTQIQFRQFIKHVEFNTEQQEVQRRDKILLKKKNKENWLTKSKIIPPSFSKISREPSNPQECNPMLHLASFYDYRRTTPVIESETELRTLSRGPALRSTKDLQQRKECKTSHTIMRGYQRPKPNWKLQYRRDELNVLKYMRQEEEQPLESSPKSFKVRKVQRKFEELKPSSHQIYRSNIDNIRQVTTPSPKVRYRMLNNR